MVAHLLRRPAVAAVHDTDRARLAVEVDFVPARTEYLTGNLRSRVRGKERRELRHLIGPRAVRALLHLLLGHAWHGLDHAAPGVRADAVGADLVPLHVHRDVA